MRIPMDFLLFLMAGVGIFLCVIPCSNLTPLDDSHGTTTMTTTRTTTTEKSAESQTSEHLLSKANTTSASIMTSTIMENEVVPLPTTSTEKTKTTTMTSAESTTIRLESTTQEITTSIPTTTTTTTTTTPVPLGHRVVEPCNQTICVEEICKVNGSISRPSFYARCPNQPENDQDLTNYCMCAAAYHATPGLTSDGEPGQSYVLITPDVNCEVPDSEAEKAQCQQDKCQGASKKANRQAHICEVEGKFYCACFN